MLGKDVREVESDPDTRARDLEVTGELAKKAAVAGSAGTVLGGIVGAAAFALPGLGPVIGSGIWAAVAGGAVAGGAVGGMVGAVAAAELGPEWEVSYGDPLREGRVLVAVHAQNDEEASEAAKIGRAHRRILMADDNVQHGIDDNPEGDAEKGAVLGALGGAAVGAAAGGPAGLATGVVGAVVGGLAGAAGSGAAVAAVDRVDNDNTVTGLGEGTTSGAGTDMNAGDFTTEGWEDVSPRYRTFWEERYGTSGGAWEDYEPGYRYAYESSLNPAYRGRAWSDVEPDLRRDWETRYPDRPWDDRWGTSIREAWDFSSDIEKGAALGGVGGTIAGAAAGAMAGPAGAALGGVVGGAAGAAASAAGVAAVDRVDDDTTTTGVGPNAGQT